MSCSDEFKPIDRITAEELAAMQSSSSSGEAPLSSSDEGTDISSSSEAGSSSSSSSEDANLSSSGEEQKASVSGVSQKGPFLNNSSITLWELDGDLRQTGRSFQGMTDEKGGFEIKGMELASPYALLKADGYYRNEVSGRNSLAPITLYAIADMGGKSSANVNILTHLEYYRVRALAEGGRSLGEAKRQALGEILAVFGIDGSGFGSSEEMSIFGAEDGDAALLAISILLQGNLSEGSFMALLADFSQNLAESGTWDDKAKAAGMAEWAASADLAAIRSNITGWGLSPDVPDFEKYIRGYASANSGEDECPGLNEEGEFCSNGRAYPKCGDAEGKGKHEYDPETQFCHNGYTLGKCGGKEYNPPEEVCNTGVVGKLCGSIWYDPAAKHCLDNQLYSCNEKPYNPVTQFCRDYAIHDKCGGTVEFNPATEQCCGSSKYATATQFCHNGSKVGTKCGARAETFDPDLYECRNTSKIYLKTPVSYEGESYEAVLIGTQTWMARNLNYNASGSLCYGDNTGGDSQNRCGTYGRLYNWATAMNNASSSTAVPSGVRGICPQGWHLPSDAGWMTLTDNVGGSSTAGTKLKATSGWHNNGNGTDEFGFSALPGGRGFSDGNFTNVGYYGDWWSASERSSDDAYGRYMSYGTEDVGRSYHLKSRLLSVRCLQD